MNETFIKQMLVMLVQAGSISRTKALDMEQWAMTNLVERTYDNMRLEDILDNLGVK